MAVTWNTVNNSIAQTSNTIITVRDTLRGLGIEVSDVCDTESIIEAINNLVSQWWDDVKRTIDNITFEMVGNFLTTLAALLAQLLAAAAASYTNLFLLEILAGNLLNSIVSAVVFALALLPGAELILQYYLVSSLKRDLVRRNELGQILYKQCTILVELFDSFYSLFKFEEDLLFTDLKRALKNIRRAENIIGREAAKNFYGSEPVTINGLTQADSYIERAINSLTHQNYDVVYAYIKRINAEYGITADVPKGFDVQGWTQYFTNIQPFVALNFFTYSSEPGTREYDNEVAIKNARYRQFISAMMQIMPPILQRIVLNATFKDASNIIFERVPVWANNIKVLKDLKGFLDNTVTVSDKFLNTYLNMNQVPKTPEPALFKNLATKDITWRNITSKIRIEEAGVLLFPSYWDYIKNVGGLLQNILFPVLGILKNVDSEIDNVINSDDRPGIAELSVNQFKWIEELTIARGMLSTIISSTEVQNKYGGFDVNPVVVYNSTVEAEKLMNQLKQFIRDKSFDFKTNTPKTQSADVVYETAQKYLGNLVANIYIIVNPAAAKNTISGLQAMRVAIKQQMGQDKREATLCTSFLNTVEANPLFQAAKPYLDQLLRDLEQTNVGSAIATQLLTGDLSGVIGILEGYWAANDLINLINCENGQTGGTVDPSILGLNANTSTDSVVKIERSFSQLRDQQNMMTDVIPSIMELIQSPEIFGI